MSKSGDTVNGQLTVNGKITLGYQNSDPPGHGLTFKGINSSSPDTKLRYYGYSLSTPVLMFTPNTVLRGIALDPEGSAFGGSSAVPKSYVDQKFMQKGVDYVTAGKKANSTLGDYATAEGNETVVRGNYAHAEGYYTVANGVSSHAEGQYSEALAEGSHAEGSLSIAKGNYAHSEGYTTSAKGQFSHSEGSNTTALGDGSHAEGVVHPEESRTIGIDTVYDGTWCMITDGSDTIPVGQILYYEHPTLGGIYRKVTISSGTMFYVDEEFYVTEGHESIEVETVSGAAYGKGSHAEGSDTTASGQSSHAEGSNSIALGEASHAEGVGTVAEGNNQHVGGTFNVPDTSSFEIIGNGSNNDNRSNARTLDFVGNEKLAGSITLGMGTVNEVTLTASDLKRLLALLT